MRKTGMNLVDHGCPSDLGEQNNLPQASTRQLSLSDFGFKFCPFVAGSVGLLEPVRSADGIFRDVLGNAIFQSFG
jgi:hypothetical protein